MKNVVVLCVSLVMVLNSFGQTSDIQKRFKSDIITYVDNGDWAIKIIPLQEDKTSPITEYGLNQQLVIESVLTSINNLRSENGVSELTFSNEISDYLTTSNLNDLPLSQGFTWGTYGLFSEYGFIAHFENKELKFCDYLLDVMSLDSDLFSDLTNPSSKTVGVFFSQNYSDKTYNFMILVK